MTKYKCIDNMRYERYITKGSVYEGCLDDNIDGMITITKNNNGKQDRYYASRFELVEETFEDVVLKAMRKYLPNDALNDLTFPHQNQTKVNNYVMTMISEIMLNYNSKETPVSDPKTDALLKAQAAISSCLSTGGMAVDSDGNVEPWWNEIILAQQSIAKALKK